MTPPVHNREELLWEAENLRYQEQAPAEVVHHEDDPFSGEYGPYDPSDYSWSQDPPDDGTCRECYAWGRYPPEQGHFGLIWWRVCGWDCDHAHHDDEVWLG